MEKGNVLVIGNSGVGKSTLINSVLGDDRAKTGWGTEGTTKALEVYEGEKIPFRVIDSVGFEPSYFKERQAINAVKKWSKECAKTENANSAINVIWFCVDGTSRKLFDDTIQDLSKATALWESVPVIVVITKSYSEPERKENIDMVHSAFAKQKRYANNLRGVIPVVAATYPLDDVNYVAPDGISELIDATNELIPEGKRAAEEDLAAFKLSRKRALAQSVIGVATAGGAVVGAVPIPFADALILTPTEIAEVNALARIYGIKNDEKSKRFLNSIVEVGTVGAAAKAAIGALKAIPGLNLAAGVINAIIAASIIAALGEGSVYAFEQIYLGNKTVEDIDWVKKLMESKFTNQFIEKAQSVLENAKDENDKNAWLKAILDLFSKEKE